MPRYQRICVPCHEIDRRNNEVGHMQRILAGTDEVVGIRGLDIGRHCGGPVLAAPERGLRLIHQFPGKNRRVIPVLNAGQGIHPPDVTQVL